MFIVTALAETRERLLLCLDRRTGKQLWRQTVFTAPLERKHGLNSFASSTLCVASYNPDNDRRGLLADGC